MASPQYNLTRLIDACIRQFKNLFSTKMSIILIIHTNKDLSILIVNIILTMCILCVRLEAHPMSTPKEEMVRANFTVLQSDLKLLDTIKKRCLLLGVETNKSELIRAGIDSL